MFFGSTAGSRIAPPRVSLPSGAIGLWSVDAIETSSGRGVLPNEMSVVPISPTLLGAKRRVYSLQGGWVAVLATITNGYDISQDGIAGDASRYNGTGNSYLSASPVLAAGTYTMAVWVKSNTGANQDFRMRFFNDSKSATKTATTSWQRFTFTDTVSAGTRLMMPIASADDVTALDLQFHDAELFAGSSDLSQQLGGHMYLGAGAGIQEPVLSGGELDFSTGSKYGIIQFPSSTSLTACTVVAIFSEVAAGSSFHGLLSKIGSFTQFTAYTKTAGPKSLNNTSYHATSSMWRLQGTGYHFIAHRSGSDSHLFLDDLKLMRSTATIATSIQDLHVGQVSGNYGGSKIQAIALWDRALSDAEIAEAKDYLLTRANGVSISPFNQVVIAEGDSITEVGISYAGVLAATTPQIVGANLAKGVGTLATGTNSMEGRKEFADMVIPSSPGDRKFIYTFMIGRNDGPTRATAADYVDTIEAFVAARRAAGFTHVLIGTILPGPQAETSYQTWRNDVNTLIRAGIPGVDGIFDFAADATMGPDIASANLTYYNADQIHPIAAGQNLLEPIYRAAIEALL